MEAFEIVPQSFGGTSPYWVAVPEHQRLVHLLHYLSVVEDPFGDDSGPLFICGIKFCYFVSVPCEGFTEVVNGGVVTKKVSDAIDGGCFSLSFRVGEKNDLMRDGVSRGDIYQPPFGALPDNMVFGFQPDIRPFSDCPTKYLYTSVTANMLWNDVIALLRFISESRSMRDSLWSALGVNREAEL